MGSVNGHSAESKEQRVDAISNERRLEILHILGAEICASCGAIQKTRRRSHCRECYFKLPPLMRQALYQRFGHGYEEAFEESLAYLRRLANKGEQSGPLPSEWKCDECGNINPNVDLWCRSCFSEANER